MSPINRCSIECPSLLAERALYRHDQLRSSDTRRLIAIARMGIMGTVIAAQATYGCPQRNNSDSWQPAEACGRRAKSVMASRPFNWAKLTELEQKALSPYRDE